MFRAAYAYLSPVAPRGYTDATEKTRLRNENGEGFMENAELNTETGRKRLFMFPAVKKDAHMFNLTSLAHGGSRRPPPAGGRNRTQQGHLSGSPRYSGLPGFSLAM